MDSGHRQASGHDPLQNFTDLVRVNALRLLSYEARDKEFSARPCTRHDLAFNQYLALILLYHPALTARLAVHFMLKEAEHFARAKAKVGAKSPVTHAVIDFFKEYCNILAGSVANDLWPLSFRVARSLPFAIQGYNDIFFPNTEANSSTAAFYLVSGSCRVGLSLDMTVLDPSGLAPLSLLDLASIEAKTLGGGFEFL